MIKIKEDALHEMALVNISSTEDDLPFLVQVKLPDHSPPHAHIVSHDGKTDLGQILIPKAVPQYANDIEMYKGKLSDADRVALFAWMKKRSKRQPKLTNWEMLNTFWGSASK